MSLIWQELRTIAGPAMLLCWITVAPWEVHAQGSGEPSAPSLTSWISAAPVVSIGGVDSPEPYVFGEISGAVLTSSGSMVVADGQAQEIRAFDSKGRHLWTTGGLGDGPGEFRGLSDVVAFRGDSIAAWDPPSRRLTIYNSFGALVRTHRVEILGYRSSERLKSIGGSRFVLVTQPSLVLGAYPLGSIQRFDVKVAVIDSEGEVQAEIGTFPDKERAFYTVQGRNWSSPPPFARYLSVGTMADRVYVGTQDSLAFEIYAGDGTHLETVRVAELDLSIDQDLKDQYWADVRRQREKGGRLDEADLNDRLRNAPYPETRAAFQDLLLDPHGYVWLKASAGPAGLHPRHWWIVGPDRQLLGRLEFPHGFRPLEVGKDYVLGVWTGPLDVESVRLYPLDRDRL